MPSRPPTQAELLGRRHDRDRDYNRGRSLDPASAAAKRFYASAQWQSLRLIQLGRFPLCRACEQGGLTVPAVDVDHVVPLRQGGAPADLANLQSLCRRCHASKTRSEPRA